MCCLTDAAPLLLPFLYQAIVQLAENGCKFTKPGGEVVISIAPAPPSAADTHKGFAGGSSRIGSGGGSGGGGSSSSAPHDTTRIEVTVADTGIGIPVNQQHLILRPFSQARGSRSAELSAFMPRCVRA